MWFIHFKTDSQFKVIHKVYKSNPQTFTHNHKESVSRSITLEGTTTYLDMYDKHSPRYSVGVNVSIVLLLLNSESGSFFKQMTIAKTLYISKSIESASLANSLQKQENFSGKTKDLEFILVCMSIFQRTKRQKCYLKP